MCVRASLPTVPARTRVAREAGGHGYLRTPGQTIHLGTGVADSALVGVLDGAGPGTTARMTAGAGRVTRNPRGPAAAGLGGSPHARPNAAVRASLASLASLASGVTYPVAAGDGGGPAALYSTAGGNGPSRSAPPAGRTRNRPFPAPVPPSVPPPRALGPYRGRHRAAHPLRYPDDVPARSGRGGAAPRRTPAGDPGPGGERAGHGRGEREGGRAWARLAEPAAPGSARVAAPPRDTRRRPPGTASRPWERAHRRPAPARADEAGLVCRHTRE